MLHHLGLHPHSDLDTSKLALETDDSVLQGARSLAEAFGTISRAQFEKMEKALGIVHSQLGPLNCPALHAWRPNHSDPDGLDAHLLCQRCIQH